MSNEKKNTSNSYNDEDDITKIKSQQKLIESLWEELKKAYKNEDFFEALLKNLPQAIYFKDTQSRFLRASKFLTEQLNQKSEKDLIGNSDFDFFNKSHANQAFKDEQEIMKTGLPILNYEEMEDHPDGRVKWVSTTKMPLYDKHGELIGTYGVSRDITETKKAKAESRAKELFLANMSHEIRTPINAIVGLTRVLLKTHLDASQKKYLDVINTSCDNLIMIVNDILDLSKLGVKKISLNPQNFKLRKIIDSIITGFEGRALEKKITIRHHVDEDIPEVLYGDTLRLNQILLNLISNALKFTTKGYVSISCILLETNDDINLVSFEIKDTGKGMKDTSLIFNQYEQEHSEVASEFGGTGLGLAICQELVQLFGGEITVLSEFEKGSTFTITIPLKTGIEQQLEKENTVEVLKEELISDKKVLLVDDDDLNRFVAETVLKGWGIEVHHATDGKECISKFYKENFDLVLMDMRMPVMDGLQATKYIRTDLKSDIPIVAMTANSFEEERTKCFEAGMNDYIMKPFDPDKLLGIIMKLTLKKRGHKSLKNKSSKPSKASNLYNLDYLKGIFENDIDLREKALYPFLKNTSQLLENLKNNFETKNISNMKEIVHKLISSINMLKIEKLYSLIRSLESDLLTEFNNEDANKKINTIDHTLREVMKQLTQEIKQE